MKAYLVLVLAIVLAVLGVVYLVQNMFTEPWHKKYERRQLDAAIAMARADSAGVPVDDKCAVQKAIIDVALRRQVEIEKKDPSAKVSFLQMLRSCNTFYPDGWKHSAICVRSVWAIWGSARYKDTPWDDVKNCVIEKLQAGIDRSACAMKYTRIERRYGDLTDEDKAAQTLESTMDIDPRLPKIDGMKFLCPRP